jgi:hypothetical protein
MKLSWLTAQHIRNGATTRRSYASLVSRQLLAALVAGLMITGPRSPVFAQEPGGSPPPGQQQPRPPLPVPQSPEQNRPSQDPNAATQQPKPAYGAGPVNPPIPVSLGVYQHRYDKAPKQFPNLFAPYRSITVPTLPLTQVANNVAGRCRISS